MREQKPCQPRGGGAVFAEDFALFQYAEYHIHSTLIYTMAGFKKNLVYIRIRTKHEKIVPSVHTSRAQK
jgi:hypothetical protein